MGGLQLPGFSRQHGHGYGFWELRSTHRDVGEVGKYGSKMDPRDMCHSDASIEVGAEALALILQQLYGFVAHLSHGAIFQHGGPLILHRIGVHHPNYIIWILRRT